MAQQTYVGVEHDTNAGMTHIGRVIRDAWVFGIIEESEDCSGWEGSRIQNLYEQVYASWEKYGHLPSALPEPLRSRYVEIYENAISKARAAGWDATLGEDD